MKLTYKAINAEGDSYTDSMEVADRYELARILKGKGETLVSVDDPNEESAFSVWIKKINNSVTTVKLKEKIFFAQNLSAMLAAGLSLSRALTVTERQTRNKKFKAVIIALQTSVQKGHSLSDSLAEHPRVFPPIFISMVHAGEESGRVADALTTIASQLDQAYQLKRKIKGAMMYPSIIMIAMVIVGVLMMMFVVPTLTATFVELNVDLPKSTQLIIFVSDFMKNNVVITLGLMIGVIVLATALFRWKKTRRGYEWLFLHMPLIKGLVQETNAAQTTRTMASLLTAGVEIVQAIEITREVMQNSYYKEVLIEAEELIQKGKPMSEAFLGKEHLYPVLVGEMMAVGEEVGNLSEMLDRVATFYEDDVSQRTKDLSTIIEPFLMVIIGGVVGFFAISMITPIYSLSSGI